VFEVGSELREELFFPALRGTVPTPRGSLERLTGVPADPTPPTTMTRRFAEAWATPFAELTFEQVRLLVSQQGGLEHLAEPVTRFVAAHPEAEVSFYPGDLTLAALRAFEELLTHAPKGARAMARADYGWIAEHLSFDPTTVAEAEALVAKAKRLAGVFD
jgi:hypothetical protein